VSRSANYDHNLLRHVMQVTTSSIVLDVLIGLTVTDSITLQTLNNDFTKFSNTLFYLNDISIIEVF